MTASFTDSIQALDQQLIQLVYRSRSLIEGAQYDKLMATCLRNNPTRGITGVLISLQGGFFRCLKALQSMSTHFLKSLKMIPGMRISFF